MCYQIIDILTMPSVISWWEIKQPEHPTRPKPPLFWRAYVINNFDYFHLRNLYYHELQQSYRNIYNP